MLNAHTDQINTLLNITRNTLRNIDQHKVNTNDLKYFRFVEAH